MNTGLRKQNNNNKKISDFAYFFPMRIIWIHVMMYICESSLPLDWLELQRHHHRLFSFLFFSLWFIVVIIYFDKVFSLLGFFFFNFCKVLKEGKQ